MKFVEFVAWQVWLTLAIYLSYRALRDRTFMENEHAHAVKFFSWALVGPLKRFEDKEYFVKQTKRNTWFALPVLSAIYVAEMLKLFYFR
jgi:hypothetical protein